MNVYDLEEVYKSVAGLTGELFCFTGSGTKYRADLERIATGIGGVVKNTVTKALTYLIIPYHGYVSAKVDKVHYYNANYDLDIKIITESEFLKLAKKNQVPSTRR